MPVWRQQKKTREWEEEGGGGGEERGREKRERGRTIECGNERDAKRERERERERERDLAKRALNRPEHVVVIIVASARIASGICPKVEPRF